jgi:hypothetical protein
MSILFSNHAGAKQGRKARPEKRTPGEESGDVSVGKPLVPALAERAHETQSGAITFKARVGNDIRKRRGHI